MGFKIYSNHLPQQKVLRKILKKVFITKKFTKCKSSRTLKIDVFEIPDKQNIGKLFLKYYLLFLDQANPNSVPSQILILWCPKPRASLLPSPSLSNFTLGYWNHPSTQSSSCSSSVSLFCPTQFNHMPATTKIGYTKPYGKLSQSNLSSSCVQIVMLYVSNTLPMKKLSRATSLSKLYNPLNNNSIFNTKYVEFFTKW